MVGYGHRLMWGDRTTGRSLSKDSGPDGDQNWISACKLQA